MKECVVPSYFFGGKKLKMDLELKRLGEFIGTVEYYNVFNTHVTQGICYIMENGYSWFVTDVIAIIKFKPKPWREPFLTVKLKLTAKNEADMIIEDGDYNRLYRQHYDYTDAKRELTLFYTGNVLMLSSEY